MTPSQYPVPAREGALAIVGKAAPPARQAGSAPSVTALLKALRRRWLLASLAGVFLAAAAAAVVWFWLPPPDHVAASVFHVSAVKPSILDPEPVGRAEFVIFQQSQKAIITSRAVLLAALRDPRVAENSLTRGRRDPIAWLQRELKVDFKYGPEYMRLSLAGERPDEQTALIAAVTDAYLGEVVTKDQSRQRAHLQHIEKIRAAREENLRRKRESVRKLALGAGTTDPEAMAIRQRYAYDALGQVQNELLQVQSERRRLSLELKAKEDRAGGLAGGDVPDKYVEEAVEKDESVARLRALADEAQARLDQALPLAVRGLEEPALLPLIRKRDRLRTQLEQRRTVLRPLITEQLRDRAGKDARASLADLKERDGLLAALEKTLEDDAGRLRKQATSLNVNQLDIEHLKNDIEQAEKIAEQLAARAAVLEVELAALDRGLQPRISVMEEPYVSQDDPQRHRVKAAGLAGFGTLFCVLGLFAWREYRQHRVDSAHEVSDELGIPLMGTVPPLPRGRQGSAYNQWQSVLTECVDGTRTRLLHAASTGVLRAVMVTSAVPREGKTSLASHLAASLARSGRRTLLIDGDIRLPAIHRLFNLSLQPGLSEVLRGQVTTADAVRPSHVSNLWVMTGGQPDPFAVQALSQRSIQDILAELREQYDYLVVDSAPILPVVDGLLIAQQVDGVILSVLRGVSQLPAVQAAYERLTSLNVRMLGAVVHGAAVSGGYGHWDSYGSYTTAPREPDEVK